MKEIIVTVIVFFAIMLCVSYPPMNSNAGELQQIKNTETTIEQNKTVTDAKLQQLEDNLVILESLQNN